MYVLLYKPLYVIYYKELAHVIWSLIPEICKLKTQEKPLFQFKSESRKKLMSKFEGCQAGGILFYLKGRIGFFGSIQAFNWLDEVHPH